MYRHEGHSSDGGGAEEEEEEYRSSDEVLSGSADGPEDENDGTASSSAASAARPSFEILSTPQLEHWITLHHQIDVGSAGNVVWSVSSAKHGNGVRHLMHHHDLHTYWQSDGVLPHVIRIRLGQLTPVEALALYVNSAVDQSYSPRVIKVRAGTHDGDMTEVAKADIGAGQQCGWVLLRLGDGAAVGGGAVPAAAPSGQLREATTAGELKEMAPRDIPYRDVAAVVGGDGGDGAGLGAEAADRWLWCTMLDVCVCENQFNGRDCHLRGICLTGPRYEEVERHQMDQDTAAAMTTATAAAARGGPGATEALSSELDWLLR